MSVLGDGAHGEIRDPGHGVGIEASVLPRVFDLFTQADNTLDRSQGGLGVGLTLVRSLVALHGGTVRAESAGPGKGSSFVVRLPLVESPVSSAAAEDSPAAAAVPLTVLIIEDNEDIRAGLCELLNLEGHVALAAASGEEGIGIALERRPHAILIDIGLPGLDGYAVARRLRQDLSSSVRLVALTGYGSAEDRNRSFAAGFDEHITKPTTFSVLTRVLTAGGEAPLV